MVIPTAPPTESKQSEFKQPESKQSDPSAVVVPTLDKQNSPTDTQPQNDQKSQEKLQDDNN